MLISLGALTASIPGDVLLVDNIGRTVRDKVGPPTEQRVDDEVGGVLRYSADPARDPHSPTSGPAPPWYFEVYDRLSLALVTESGRPIRVGDRVHSP